MVKNSATTSHRSPVVVKNELPDDNEDSSLPTPNLPVSIRRDSDGSETAFDRDRRRMKWVAQISEYWPLSRLANMSKEEMEDVLTSNAESATPPSASIPLPSIHTLSLSPPKSIGRILLVGSGPGHPALLTRATHSALTEHAQLVLSDKLVPAAVLALIPAHVEVRIARKFPGNADGAQHELMLAAVDAAQRGLTVVRVRLSLCIFTLFCPLMTRQ
jgi:uroporphyrin-III C-methyltransferase